MEYNIKFVNISEKLQAFYTNKNISNKLLQVFQTEILTDSGSLYVTIFDIIIIFDRNKIINAIEYIVHNMIYGLFIFIFNFYCSSSRIKILFV